MRKKTDPSPTELRIPIEAGLCELVFRTYTSTGKDPNTRPGIGFDCESTQVIKMEEDGSHSAHKGKFYLGAGVLARDKAAELRDYLTAFLNECPSV